VGYGVKQLKPQFIRLDLALSYSLGTFMNIQKQKIQQGFTLIEIVIVIAIIVILIAVAFPAYQQYIVQQKVSESMALADPLKQAIVQAAAKGDISAASNEDQAAADLLGAPLNTAISNDVVESVSVKGTSVVGVNPQTANITIVFKKVEQTEQEQNPFISLSATHLVIQGTIKPDGAPCS
jgi:type IV pilus assembly protein PilA